MKALQTLMSGESLTQDQTREFFQRLIKGELNDIQVSAALIAMKMRGETPAELAGAAEAILSAAKPFLRSGHHSH